MILSAKPALIISEIFMWPLENTMAFGGVATGIMKAQLAAMAAGTVNSSGETSCDIARAPSSGRNAVAVAVLLVTSVRKIITPATRIIITSTGKVPATPMRSEEHTSELQSRPHLVCRLLLEKKNNKH